MLGWFRDNQHRMLVFFTVMLMAGFGVMGVISNSTSSNRPDPSTVKSNPVKSWKYGNVTDTELNRIRSQRQGLQALQSELIEEARKYQESFQPQSGLLFGRLTESASDQEVYNESFRIMLLAKKAEDMGMVVSEATADAYFSRLVDQWVPFDQIKAIANEVGADSRISYADFREIAKREILASYAAVVCVGGKPSMPTPTQAYQYYKMLTKRIECQVLGFPVEDYLPKVSGQPSEAEIKALFEEGKYSYAAFDHSEPGFKIQNRLQLQYFSADEVALIEKFKSELTDEEIQAEYDRLVADKAPLVYDAQLSESTSPLDLIPGGETIDETEDNANSDSLPELPGMENESGDTSSDSAETGQTEAESSEESNAGTEAKQPATDKPPVPKTESGSGENAKIDHLKNSEQRYYVTAQEESESQDESSDSQLNGGLDLGALTTDAQETPATEGKIRPLEEVREEIKTRLARPEAYKEIDRVFSKLRKEVLAYRTDVRLFEADPKNQKQPVDLNFEELAKKYDLTFRETGAMDYRSFSETALGLAGAQRGFTYADQVFGRFDDLKRYSPDSPSQTVLVWVSRKIPAEIPTLEDAKEKVVDYWKYQEAIKLAEAAAKAKADEIEASGKLMKETTEEAVQTGGFTWFTMNPYQGNVVLSQLPGVTFPGEAFMEAAFGLDVNGTATALNADGSIVYVIQKTADAGFTEAEMQENFLASTAQMARFPQQVGAIAGVKVSEATNQFIANLQTEYDCKDLQ